jgi:hypothetical protein
MQQAQYSSDDTDGRYEVPFKVLWRDSCGMVYKTWYL